MYQEIIAQNRDSGLLTVARFNLALAEDSEDCTIISKEMNKILSEPRCLTNIETERLLLDTFQSAFSVYVRGQSEVRKTKFQALFQELFKGLAFYEYSFLLDVYEKVSAYRKDFNATEKAEALYHVSNVADKNTLLSYIIKRETLNLLIRTPAFLQCLALIRTLVSELEVYPEEVKNSAAKLSGDLYFYDPLEGDR